MGAVTDHLDSNTHHLDQMAKMVQQLEGAKTVDSLARHSYDPSDISFKTQFATLITSYLVLMTQALEKEAENCQKQYHADHPGIFQDVMTQCQEMKDKTFDGGILTIKKILRSKNTPSKGIHMHRPYPECVFVFCDEMLKMKRQMVCVIQLCRNQIYEENNIKQDTARCLEIYHHCYKKMVEKNMPFIKIILKAQTLLDKDEPQAYDLACRMKEATNREEAICQCFHAYDERTLQLFVAYDYADKIRSQKRQSEEYAIWRGNEEMALKSIHVLENFDSIGNEVIGKRLKAGEQQHNIKAMSVLMFYKWCSNRGCQCSESQFVNFFGKHYKGIHKPPSLSSVNGKKNRSSFSDEEYQEFAKKVDKIADGAPSLTATSIPIGW